MVELGDSWDDYSGINRLAVNYALPFTLCLCRLFVQSLVFTPNSPDLRLGVCEALQRWQGNPRFNFLCYMASTKESNSCRNGRKWLSKALCFEMTTCWQCSAHKDGVLRNQNWALTMVKLVSWAWDNKHGGACIKVLPRLATSDGVQNVTGKSPLAKRSYNKAPTPFAMHYGCPISNTDLILNDADIEITESSFSTLQKYNDQVS